MSKTTKVRRPRVSAVDRAQASIAQSREAVAVQIQKELDRERKKQAAATARKEKAREKTMVRELKRDADLEARVFAGRTRVKRTGPKPVKAKKLPKTPTRVRTMKKLPLNPRDKQIKKVEVKLKRLKSGGGSKRAPSAYNLFVKDYMGKLKSSGQPFVITDAMRGAAAAWQAQKVRAPKALPKVPLKKKISQ